MQSKCKKPGLRRLLKTIVMSLVMLLGVTVMYVANPGSMVAQAADTVASIRTSIDPNVWQVIGAVVEDNFETHYVATEAGVEIPGQDAYGALDGYTIIKITPEEKRLGMDVLQAISGSDGFAQSITHLDGLDIGGGLYYMPAKASQVTEYCPVLTFPNGERGAKTDGNDMNQAALCINQLANDLNAAFLFANGGSYEPAGNTEDEKLISYKDDMVKFLTKVNAAASGTSASYTSNGHTSTFTCSGDMLKITMGSTTQEFQYQMDKGYDTGLQKVNWGHIALSAFEAYISGDIGPEDIYTSNRQPSDFETKIIELFNSLAEWIRSSLGMWGIDELVFNFNLHRDPLYPGGVYPASWENVIWTLFFVCEVAAFLILAVTIVTNVLRKIMSTVNPILRTSLIDQAKNLMLVAFALGLLPLLLQLLVRTSATITGIFGDLIGPGTFNDRFTKFSTQSGLLGGVIMQFLYLSICISFNVTYIIRSYMLAMLVITSPIFVMFFAMGDNKKALGKLWLMELLSNIFIQPIHAFVLGVVLLLPGSARPVEALVMLYCVMPISSIIRGLFFGDAGASPLKTAQAGIKAFKGNAQTAWRTGTSAAGSIAGGVAGAIAWGKKRGEKRSEDSKSDGEKSESREGTANTQANSTVAARNATSKSGPAVFESQGKTSREQMADTIREGGEIPSVGMEGHIPSVADSVTDKDEAVKAAMVGGGVAAAATRADFASRGAGSNMAATVRQMPRADGSVQYQVPRTEMHEAGFTSFRSKTNGGNEFITTDTGYRGTDANGEHSVQSGIRSAYSAADARNYADMARIFATGTEAQKQALRNAGYDFVGAEMKGSTPTGRFSVATNKNFSKEMGYQPTAGKDGGLNIKKTGSGEMSRTPDVQKILNPDAYQRVAPDGQVGYTEMGMNLRSTEPEMPSTMPVSKGTQQANGGHEIPASTMSDMGMSFQQGDDGRVTVTYDAGIMGQDEDGATVYTSESKMSMPDRKSVAQIQQMWDGGNEADRAYLESQGIENVIAYEQGQVAITYSQIAQENMGGRISATDDHVIVQPTSAEAPVQTVAPIAVKQVRAADQPRVVVPTQEPGKAYQPSEAPAVKVPITASAPPAPKPAPAPAPTPAPTPAPAPPPAPAPQPTQPAMPDFITQPYMGKPGADKRMKRRENNAKHRR